ncbi:MAG: PKD domain containing protein [Candidatus Magnetoglobus multicellularis str. Araruama]|uniref:PKD domain containing protein n=1 Tax=Candidatus Magnetoglobus multicellularis str. Araruama TaxID=890399 RepID=A0A1V1P523_9BACT|nr:MAG: PKD domain containing protein [Candidatus Magnetoglobus multicellularis str. Araruama]
MILNADNDTKTSNMANDVRWEDFTYDGLLFNSEIKLGRRTFAEDYQEVSDGWDPNTPSQLFAINFKEERIRGASGLNDLFDQSNQAGIFKQGFALSIMIQEVLEFTGAEKVILVGHSMGGLAIREYLQRTDQNENQQWWINPYDYFGHQVAKVVTIGTPHLGSNAGCDPTRENRKRSGKPDFNGTSEAMRDLKYSFDSYPNCDLLNPVGIYLFGGNENCLKNTLFDRAFHNVDINCNGSDDDFITGLNQGLTDNPNMPLPANIPYTWIISDISLGENPACLNWPALLCTGGDYNCDDEPPGDGSVLLERQWLHSEYDTSEPYGISNRILTQSRHNEEGSDYPAIIKALDEPDVINLAYLIDLNQTISGLITPQPDDASQDIDIYKLENLSSAPSKFTVRINCVQNIVQEISIIDCSGNPFSGSSIYEFPYDLTFYTGPDNPGDIFIKITGAPFDESWQYPYTISLTRDFIKIDANFEADQTNGNAPFTVNFSDLSTTKNTNISSWQWNFGDGTTSQEKNPQHTYSSPGIYKVSLTVSDMNHFKDVEQKYNYIVVQSDQIITSDINIVAIEYFFDTDPGFENGISLPLTPANDVSIKTTIETSHLSPGLHRLYVRAKDENGIWGILQARPVLITQNIQSNDDPLTNITHVEYFFDEAPEFGNGNTLSFLANSDINLIETINVSNLAPGLHRLYIRAKDETGTWGIVQSRPVLITQRLESDNGQHPLLSKVTQIEYFFDVPPGFGNGNSFTFNENSHVDISETINISNLDPGLHRLYIRAKDESGIWGIVQSRPVFVTNNTESEGNELTSQLKLTNIEYFFDTPPGFGNGTTISFLPYSQVELNQTIDVSDLTPGLHRIYVRALDEIGQWGIVQSKPVLITKKFPDNNESPEYCKITDIEYFFDHTTDFGNGSRLSFNPDSSVALNETIDISELSPGLHRLYIRAKDETETWGIVQSRPVLIQAVDDSLPDIVKIEYFFNTDPGQGSGSNILFEPSPYVHFKTNVPIHHLQKGDHRMYVRAQDENDAWSQSQSATFSIIDSPPVIANAIQDIVVLSNANNQAIDLSQVFKDPDDLHAQLHFSVYDNSCPELVSSTINNTILTLSYPSGQTGEAVIAILAASDGTQISCSFSVQVNAADMTLITTNALSGNIVSHLQSVTAPFSAKFHVAGDITRLAESYQWDIDSDGQIDRHTYDNEISYTFRNEGDYTTKVIAMMPDGSTYHQSISLSVQPSHTVNDYIKFVPWYPSNDDIASEIMNGGKAVRCYQTFDRENKPIQNKQLYYQFNTTEALFVAEIDNNGFVYIETPEIYEDSYYEIILTNKTGDANTIQSQNAPSFYVYLNDREMTEEYTLLLGMGGSIGIGAGANIGPIQLKLASLGFYGGKNIANTMEIQTIGEKADLLIENLFGIELKAELSTPIFEKAWKAPVKPELSFGAGLEAQVKQSLTTRYRFNDFFDNPENDKLIAAAAFFWKVL